MAETVTRTDRDSSSRLDQAFGLAALGAFGVLAFLGGVVVAVLGLFPGPQVNNAIDAVTALYEKSEEGRDAFSKDIWYEVRRKEKGVTVSRPDLIQAGVTLYSSGNEAAAHLIDAKGNVLHTWRRPFSSLGHIPGGVENPQPDTHVFFRHVQLLDDGSLLAVYEGAGDTPYGYGVVKLDADSNVVWVYPGRAHHQLDVAPDGRVFVLTHELVDSTLEGFPELTGPKLEDFLVILSPDGKELKKIRLIAALLDSPYSELLSTISTQALEDPTHANAVRVIRPEKAAGFAFGEEGQVILSFRELHAIAVFDPEEEALVWMTRGPWVSQHDPELLANGHILLFDNLGNYAEPEGQSRVIEFDPATGAITWQYAGTEDNPLDSDVRSDQQRLANGNTLITESTGGRILEVTRDGTIAWEFVNPVRGGEKDDRIPIVTWAERLDSGLPGVARALARN